MVPWPPLCNTDFFLAEMTVHMCKEFELYFLEVAVPASALESMH